MREILERLRGGPIAGIDAHPRAKIDLGLCEGKVEYDKRDDIKKREHNREMQRAVRHTVRHS